jgi:flagellar biogenesis protein FliO
VRFKAKSKSVLAAAVGDSGDEVCRCGSSVRFAIVASLVCIAAGATIFPRIDETPFHGDESGWISSAYHYTDLLLTLDPTSSKWECQECSTWGSLNLHLGQWLIGLPLVMDPGIRGRRFSQYYDFDLPSENNVAQGRIPPRDILLRGRRAVAVVGVLCCLIVFSIGYLAYGLPVGVLAASLVLTNQLFITYATRAVTDVHYSFFLLCLCLAMMLLARSKSAPSTRGAIQVGAIAGVLVGLATSVKVAAIVVGGLMFVAATYAFEGRRARLLAVVTFCASALIVIYGLNPFFWIDSKDLRPQPLIQELRLLALDVRTSSLQIDSARFPQLATLGRFPSTFVRWDRLMNKQLEAQPEWGWQGNRLGILHEALLSRYSSVPAGWLFLGIGVCLASSYARRRAQSSLDPPAVLTALPLLYLLANYGFILAFMKLNFERYYLPTVIASQLFVAIGLHAVVAYLLRCLRHRTRARIRDVDEVVTLVDERLGKNRSAR